MIKRFFLALAFAGLLSPAYGAGTIPLSLSQQFDSLGKPLSGCKLYTIKAGTVSTPQNAYQDTALTLPLPNPQTCDAAGRLPQMFLADGQIKVRLTAKSGVEILTADNIQVVGASSGGGGGGSVDPTTIMTTGDVKIRYGTGVISGFVRQNGRTIGSATSGATERANADTQALFEYLWNADPNLTVSTGRGSTANSDWVANKTIALPDARGRLPAGLDDMGASAAGRFGSVSFASGNSTTLGSIIGSASQSIAQSQLPNVGLSVSASGTASVTGTQQTLGSLSIANLQGGGAAVVVIGAGIFLTSTGTASVSGSTSSINGNVSQVALPTVQPTILMTIYQKL